MQHIELTQGKFAHVDDADFDSLNQFNWYAWCDKFGHWYARRSLKVNGKWNKVTMHQQLMGTVGLGSSVHVDHKDKNGLNNCRENLRVCSPRQNLGNQKKRKSTSSFKGVSWSKANKKWRAQIRDYGKECYLGYFETELEAARVYEEAAKRVFGEFAWSTKIL